MEHLADKMSCEWNVWLTKCQADQMPHWQNVRRMKGLDKMPGWCNAQRANSVVVQNIFLFHCSFSKLDHFRAYVKLLTLFKRSSLIFILTEKETMAEKKKFRNFTEANFLFRTANSSSALAPSHLTNVTFCLRIFAPYGPRALGVWCAVPWKCRVDEMPGSQNVRGWNARTKCQVDGMIHCGCPNLWL
jgi:hypothetical protein